MSVDSVEIGVRSRSSSRSTPGSQTHRAAASTGGQTPSSSSSTGTYLIIEYVGLEMFFFSSAKLNISAVIAVIYRIRIFCRNKPFSCKTFILKHIQNCHLYNIHLPSSNVITCATISGQKACKVLCLLFAHNISGLEKKNADFC